MTCLFWYANPDTKLTYLTSFMLYNSNGFDMSHFWSCVPFRKEVSKYVCRYMYACMTASAAFSINSQLLDAAMHGTNVLDDLFLWSVTHPSGPLKERSLQRFLLCIRLPNNEMIPFQMPSMWIQRNSWRLICFEPTVFRNAFDCDGQDPSLPSSRELDAIFRANLDSHGGCMVWDHRKSFPHTMKNVKDPYNTFKFESRPVQSRLINLLEPSKPGGTLDHDVRKESAGTSTSGGANQGSDSSV